MLPNIFLHKYFLILFIVLLLASTLLGQTTIAEKTYALSKADYNDCYTGRWNLKIPMLYASSPTDIRGLINDSISSIVDAIWEDVLYGSNNVNYDLGCDTNSLSFVNPFECTMYYRIGQNIDRILSMEIFVNYSAGGGGNGFGTDYYSFNLDLIKNEFFFVNRLFDSTKTHKLIKYISENVESFNEGIQLDEDFNIFGNSEDGSYRYAGFRIDSTSLVINYSINYGRGNGINQMVLPLEEIKQYVNREYWWVIENQ